jgi:hypothetical protein
MVCTDPGKFQDTIQRRALPAFFIAGSDQIFPFSDGDILLILPLLANKFKSVKKILSNAAMGFVLVAGIQAQEVTITDAPIDPNTKLITYQEVVPETGTKDELFNRCVYWLNEFYKNPVEVTKVRDQASGIIKGQHQIRLHLVNPDGIKVDAGVVLYNFKVELRENRYRYTVDNFVLKQVSRFPAERWLNKADPEYSTDWPLFIQQIDVFIRDEFVPALKAKMKPEVKVPEVEW